MRINDFLLDYISKHYRSNLSTEVFVAMKQFIKKTFPSFYKLYQHEERLKKIRQIEEMKKLSIIECAKLDEKLYLEKIGHKLDWGNLHSYTEKMQWEKLFNDNPVKAKLSDKYCVRSWIIEKIGEEYLIPLIGVWDKVEDIPFDDMPEQFVIKTNHGSGTNIIVRDKNKLNLREAKRQLNDWMKIDYGYSNGFELHYSKIKPCIIAEKYLETEYGELQDYKFLCFDGKPYYCWVDLGRYSNHTRDVYDLDWKLQPWNQATYSNYPGGIAKPKNFDMMIRVAEILSEGFPHVRVDLYNIDGRIYFGEMTFTNGGGLDAIIPGKYDLMLGELWNIETPVPSELINK